MLKLNRCILRIVLSCKIQDSSTERTFPFSASFLLTSLEFGEGRYSFSEDHHIQYIHWIGLPDDLQETHVFIGKIHGVL